MDFDRSVFRPAYANAGMWDQVRVTSPGSPPIVTETQAGYIRPSVAKNGGGALSTEHEMKYQTDTLPDLAEGHTVEFLSGLAIGITFQVRSAPFVRDDPGDDCSGYFKSAYLTLTAYPS